jgi:hypothetical protein
VGRSHDYRLQPVEFRDSTVRLQARTAFPFAAFVLPPPRVMRVLSIEDPICLDVDRTLRPAS